MFKLDLRGTKGLLKWLSIAIHLFYYIIRLKAFKRGLNNMNNDFITVKELSEQLNVTVQTVYKYLNEIDKEEYTKKIKNKLHISSKGVEIITNLYNENNYSPNDPGEEKEELLNIEIMARYIDTLEEQIKIKDEQLKNKDELLINLTERLRESNIIFYNKALEERENSSISAADENSTQVNERKTLLERFKSIFRRV